jgi:co-chaperonin GroES (HSP10)
MEVKVGDTILSGSGKYATCEVTGADVEDLIMRREDVLGILQ